MPDHYDDSSVVDCHGFLWWHPPGNPWAFIDNDGEHSYFATEEEACAVQRDYRRRQGFDEMTGAPC